MAKKALAKTEEKAVTDAIVPGSIKIVVLKVQKWGRLFAYFHPCVTGWINIDAMPKICVSRVKPGGCNFRLDRLDTHDNHAPGFGSDSECDLYIQRVIGDIAAADCGGVTISVEIQVAETEKPTEVEYKLEEGDSTDANDNED